MPTAEKWYGFSIYLPSGGSEDYGVDYNDGREIIFQWHAEPDLSLGDVWRSPPLSIDLDDGNYYIKTRGDDRWISPDNSAPYQKTYPIGSFVPDKGKWVDWVFHVKWSWTGDGILEVWKDGANILDLDNLYMGYNDKRGPYIKWGIYKWPWKEGPSDVSYRYLYHDEIRVGNEGATYDDVAPRGEETGCGNTACDGDESCKSCPEDCDPCAYPSASLTNNDTMTSNSNNFASNRPIENLWDGCNSTADDDCTSGAGDISSFWVEFDLGQEYDLTQARLFGDTSGLWISSNWSLLYKIDQEGTWSTAFTGTDAFMDGWSEQDLAATARHVRVEVFSDTGATQARELELYGDAHTGSQLALHLPMDEGSGIVAHDSSGNGNDAIILNGTTWTDGRIGDYALGFDDPADYAEVGTSGWSASHGSVSIWAKVESPGSRPLYLLGHTTVPAWNDRLQLYVNSSDGWLGLGLGDTHARATEIEHLGIGVWHHIALTWDGTDYAVYVDGGIRASGQYSGLVTLAPVADIGNDGNPGDRNEGFLGVLDDIRVYSRVLSPEEVHALANPHRADTSGDGCVDEPELASFITHFYLDSTAYPMGELMEAVGLWKSGAGC